VTEEQFLVQNRDPIQHSKQEFHEFCEWLEIAKCITPNNFQEKHKSNGPKGMPGLMSGPLNYGGRDTTLAPMRTNIVSFCKTQNNAQKAKLCQLHQANNTHNTNECKVLISQADKICSTWNA
jgi:hypothetical protein